MQIGRTKTYGVLPGKKANVSGTSAECLRNKHYFFAHCKNKASKEVVFFLPFASEKERFDFFLAGDSPICKAKKKLKSGVDVTAQNQD